MYKEQRIMFIWAETPVHVGSGSSVEFIDLPIQREVFTELPVIHGQSLKGAIREHLYHLVKDKNSKEKKIFEQVFSSEDNDFAGAISISQARVLAFPVASLKGVYVYATSPLVLNLLSRDLQRIDPAKSAKLSDVPTPDFDEAYTTDSESVVVNSQVILSQFCLKAKENSEVKTIAQTLSEIIFGDDNTLSFWKNLFVKNFVLLNDTTFKHLTKIKTELVYRTKINYDKGVVEKGALWTEEFLPAETVLWCNIFASDPLNKFEGGLSTAKDVADYLQEQKVNYITLGGDQSVGKGFVRLTYFGKSGGQ